jgi:hypothetical protein
MLFLTNGNAQDLPSNQQFDFWTTQEEWGRAVKVAKIRQSDVLGPAVAPHYEFNLSILMEAISTDKSFVFTSRPRGQPVDWCRWAQFCQWYFIQTAYDQQVLLDQIRRGESYAWYPTFAGWAGGQGQAARYCCDSDQQVDDTIFWDYHKFNKTTCKSTVILPETYPTPDEIAEMAKWLDWVSYKFGPDVAKNLVDSPPTPAQRAATFSPQAPTPVQDDDIEKIDDEPAEPAATESSSALLWVLGGALGLGLITMLAMKPRR